MHEEQSRGLVPMPRDDACAITSRPGMHHLSTSPFDLPKHPTYSPKSSLTLVSPPFRPHKPSRHSKQSRTPTSPSSLPFSPSHLAARSPRVGASAPVGVRLLHVLDQAAVLGVVVFRALTRRLGGREDHNVVVPTQQVIIF